jgi:hypothetical protein
VLKTLPISYEKQYAKTKIIEYSRRMYGDKKENVENLLYKKYNSRISDNGQESLFDSGTKIIK